MSHIPAGFSAVVPYLLLDRADAFLAFAGSALGATERMVARDATGRLVHAEIVVEGCVIELGQPNGPFTPTRTHLHIFVADPDAAVARALAAGATLLYPVTDHEYGERSGGVSDPWDNQYYFAAVIDPTRRATA